MAVVLTAIGVIRAVGYAELLKRAEWPGSANPTFEGHAWQDLRKLDACTLK